MKIIMKLANMRVAIFKTMIIWHIYRGFSTRQYYNWL